MPGILSKIASIFKPIHSIIDELHSSDEEKAAARLKVLHLELEASQQAADFEKTLLREQAKIVQAEAQGHSWLQRNWRPITMMTFLVLVIFDVMGWTAFRLSEDAWNLLQLGLAGYIGGRTIEKSVAIFKSPLGRDRPNFGENGGRSGTIDSG